MRRTVGRSRGYGRVVVGPLRDTTIEPKTAVAKLLGKENGKQLYVYHNTIQGDAFFHDVNCIEVCRKCRIHDHCLLTLCFSECLQIFIYLVIIKHQIK